MTTDPFRLLVLAPDAAETAATTTLLDVLDAAGADTSTEVILWEGGDHVDDLAARAPVGVVTELAGRSPGALAEKALVRVGRRGAGHAVRRRRLGLAAWGRRPPHAVLLDDPTAAPLLRYLPDPIGVPVSVLVPTGELTDANHAHLSAEDLARLLAVTDRFLVEGDDSWDHLTATLGVDPGRLVPVGEPLVDEAPTPPGEERLAGWRDRLGLVAGRPVVVGSGPLVWDGGTDLFVRLAWMVRERLGHDAAFVWVGRPGQELELTQFRHDIAHMGLEPHVHLLLGPDDGEALWLGDVHVVTSRLPDTRRLHVPATSRAQPLVGWEAPLLDRFAGQGDAAAARLVGFLDMAGLAAAVGDLLADADARAELGARGGARYRAWHVRPDHAAALAGLLRAGP